MDTGLLNFGNENFDTFEQFASLEDSISLDEHRQYYLGLEDERELNGDIGLIPITGAVPECMDLTGTPPSDIYQGTMGDWSTLVNIDIMDVAKCIAEDNNSQDRMTVTHSNPSTSNVSPVAVRTLRAPVKKIDKEAQKYIVEDLDDLVDVETVFEQSDLPVLEASDALSLLEQFENTEQCNFEINSHSFPIEIEKIPSAPQQIFETPAPVVNVIQVAPESISETPAQIETVIDPEQFFNKSAPEDVTPTAATVKVADNKKKSTKDIVKKLPQELIARINESGKRKTKTVTVIPAMPQKKPEKGRRAVKRPLEIIKDHDYCSKTTSYPKEPRKDSGFSSEEEGRSCIGNQPTVKNADGKLMVSLLKANTIHPSAQKRKLNLEEYKKRRKINTSAVTSLNASPSNSSCSSPQPEDEHTKRIKHQEKMMKMAQDLLNTPAKSDPAQCKKKPSLEPITKLIPQSIPKAVPQQIPIRKTVETMESITCVSVGINTDISTVGNKQLLENAQRLAAIKPLLQKASNKINSNSFITSLIENIPKAQPIKQETIIEDHEQIREDLMIIYRPKERQQVSVRHKSLQTNMDEEDVEAISRYRRRINRSPSVSSSRSSASSYASSFRRYHRGHDSPLSSSASSHSSSHSPSPRRVGVYDKERSDEVNERRIIYVGRIGRGTTKADLHRRFQQFGRITHIGLHFRKYGDNFGFVTFAHKESAYTALERGNDNAYPKYDLCFGGRRIFCEYDYSDLDDMREDDVGRYYASQTAKVPFDVLLKQTQEKLRNRKP